MRVLFYEDPLTDQNSMFWRSPHIARDVPWLRALLDSQVEARMLVASRFGDLAREAGAPDHALLSIREEELISALPNPLLNANTLFQRHYGVLTAAQQVKAASNESDPELRVAMDVTAQFSQRIRTVLGEFVPDVIFAWAPVPHLRALFPDALILHKESACFTRYPFPLTYYLDPGGFHRWSAMASATSLKCSDRELKQIERLRTFFDAAFDVTDCSYDLRRKLSKYRKSILVVSQTNNVFMFDGACGYRSQAHMLLDVLDHAPQDCAVVLSEHPDCGRLLERELRYIRERYQNFIYFNPGPAFPSPSQYALRHVDAVATVSSSVGLQAAFWNKPIVALGKSHLNRIAQEDSATGVAEAIECETDTSEAAGWLAFRYSYLNEFVVRPGWLHSHLERRCHAWRSGGSQGYFSEPWEDPDEIADRIEDISVALLRKGTAPAVGGSAAGPDTIDMSRHAMFSKGWSYPEFADGSGYRWIEGKRAEIVLPLMPGGDVLIFVRLGTFSGCPNQLVEFGVQQHRLASSAVSHFATTEVLVRVPASMIVEPATRIWIKTTESGMPPGDKRELSILITRISLRRAS